MSEYTSPFAAGPGVMTEEAGVLTGDLELRTVSAPGGAVTAKVRYAGTDEWYRLRGGQCKLVHDGDHQAVHSILIGVLNRPIG